MTVQVQGLTPRLGGPEAAGVDLAESIEMQVARVALVSGNYVG